MGGADYKVQDALADELERLDVGSTFTVAEFTTDFATIFEISRDEHGTPDAFKWEYPYDDGVLRRQEPDQWSAAMTDPERFYRQVAPEFIVHSPGQPPGGLRGLLPGPDEVPIYECQEPLRKLLRTAMLDSPLVMEYELAVLTQVRPGHTGAARIALTGHPMFARGDVRGCQPATVQVNIEPTDDEGTAFAVVTREQRPDLPRQARELRPLQLQAAVVPPGRYTLTAVLTRPGQVRLDGLPVELGSSARSWDHLNRLVPGQLTVQAPAHLVCLIELCGGDDRLQERIYRLEELITQAQVGGGPLRVSVVAYGAHGVAWKVDDKPPEIRAWAVPGSQAIASLRGLAGRRVDEREYQYAAQLECALRLVRDRLAPPDGRPVIVTAGGRPAHPPGLDTVRQLIPCPDYVNGTLELGRLLSLPGITFGALRDPRCRGGIWKQLGTHAVATIDDAVDMEGFATDLGLCAAVQTVPFPLIEQ